jgi:hypothetical protein
VGRRAEDWTIHIYYNIYIIYTHLMYYNRKRRLIRGGGGAAEI